MSHIPVQYVQGGMRVFIEFEKDNDMTAMKQAVAKVLGMKKLTGKFFFGPPCSKEEALIFNKGFAAGIDCMVKVEPVELHVNADINGAVKSAKKRSKK